MAPGHVLLIRADADARMGTGHLMRCLALAQTWQTNGGQVTFITACHNSGLLNRLHNEGFEVQQLPSAYPNPMDWELTQSILARYPNAWVVLDGYHFEPTYQLQIKTAGHPLLIVDDLAHLDIYHADILLNQNINAHQLTYKVESTTSLLLGTQYALLRREFWPWRGWQRQTSTVARKILVTLGGGDIDNQTLKVIHALQLLKVEDLEAIIVVGGSNPHLEVLKTAVLQSSVDIQLVQNVSNMSELMAWADIAVSAGGSTCWELAFMGLPTLILVIADNQQAISAELDQAGAAINLGWRDTVTETSILKSLITLATDSNTRHLINQKAKNLVDGLGANHVVEIMNKQPTWLADQLKLRLANLQDSEMLWQWANDPIVRENSFHPEAIPFDSHQIWFKKKLSSSSTRIWILELRNVPVAQIRFDYLEPDTAKIGFSIVNNFRGKGLGTQLLILTTKMAYQDLKVRYVKGVVFSSNRASGRAFVKAGFKFVHQEHISNKLCDIFIWECSQKNKELL